MDDDLIRLHCPACGTRMELAPRTTYAACRKCGSEYLVARRRGAWTLEPLTPDEVALSREVAAVERRQEMGCANTALSIVAFFLVLFCLIGVVGAALLRSTGAGGWLVLGAWAVAFALFVPLAVVMLRNLERDRRRRARLLARKEAAGDAGAGIRDQGSGIRDQGSGDGDQETGDGRREPGDV